MSVPSDIPAPQGVRNDDDLEVENMSVCSNKSGFLGEFLAPRQAPGRDEAAPLLEHAAPRRSQQPPIVSMGNASGFGTIRPMTPTVWGPPSEEPECLSDDDDEAHLASAEEHKHVYRELSLITKYTMPICATHLLELSLSLVSVFSLGHLGTVELAAASLAGMTANVTGFSVISGLVTALDTLLPASYTRNPKMMGLWTQRVGVIIGLAVPIIIALWLNAERGLRLLGQEPQIAQEARSFLAVLAIGLPGHALFELCRRFLQAQGLMHAPTIVLLIVSPINALANILLVWGPPWMRLGFLGAPLASAISMWLMALLCTLQCYLVSTETWDGWSWRAWDWRGLRTCTSLGMAGLLSLATEWWAWEFVGLVTAALGTTALASQSVLLITSSVTYQLPYGAAVAASVRVGNLLGAGHAFEAYRASHASLILGVLIGLLNSVIVYVARDKWGYLFSGDPEVIRLVASVLPLVALFQCADCICGIANGILRGCGRQALSALINVTAYYVVGVPFSVLLAFGPPHLALAGLWWGLTIALAYGAAVSLWYVYRMDWSHVMHHVHQTMNVGDDV